MLMKTASEIFGLRVFCKKGDYKGKNIQRLTKISTRAFRKENNQKTGQRRKESFFNWLNVKTSIQSAFHIRSLQGLFFHVFSALAFANLLISHNYFNY